MANFFFSPPPPPTPSFVFVCSLLFVLYIYIYISYVFVCQPVHYVVPALVLFVFDKIRAQFLCRFQGESWHSWLSVAQIKRQILMIPQCIGM